MKWVRRILAALACLLVLSIASVPFVAPAMAAYVCPQCYGFERAADDIYLESGDEGHAIIDAYWTAHDRTTAGFGGTTLPNPTLLICNSKPCDRRIGLYGAKGQAFGSRFITIASTGGNPTILSHELAHIMVHGAYSVVDLLKGDLPAWRDEGIAVLVSRDERYFDFDAPACLVKPEGALPVSPAEWGRAMQPDTHLTLYAQAACAVFREHGLPPYDLETLLRGTG